jgi:hypothetical protein
MLDMDIYSNSMFGGSDAEIRILMKKDKPVEFDVTLNGDVSSNADFEIETADNSHFEVASPKIEGGHRYYIAFVNYGGAQGILQMITPSVELQTPQPDAGVEDVSDNDVVTAEDSGDDTAVQPDVSEDVEVVADVVNPDAANTDIGVDTSLNDAAVKPDVIVIDGSVKEESNDESGCSCSVIE